MLSLAPQGQTNVQIAVYGVQIEYEERNPPMEVESRTPATNTSIKNELDFITAAIKANTAPESIYLFGSYANGAPNTDSDIDIYVVVPDSETDTIELCAKIRLDLAKRKTLPIDLLIGKKSIFENRKNRLTLESVVANEGIKIYG